MRVRVLVAGLYNGPEHKDPVRAQPGDVIEVAGGWYAAELIAKGLVLDGQPAPSAASLPEGADETQEAAGPTETPAARPYEPKGRKVSELRKLRDLKS